MKVALSFPGCHRRGGVERIVFECARFLAEREHTVNVFASEWEEDNTQPIHYQRVPSARNPFFLQPLSYFRSCTKRLRKESYDVLNTHGCECPVGGVHWIQSLHRAWLERSKQFRGTVSATGIRQKLNPLHPVLLKLESIHFRDRQYRKIIATTTQVRDDLNRWYGVPESDVVIIPNGFSPAEFNMDRRLSRRAEQRAKLGLKPDQIALLFVANELERKGYPTVLSAMRSMNRPDLILLVVGRANGETARQMAVKAGLENQVIVCGSTNDVSAFHAAADIFVLPTQYEAFCLAILEALGSGLPIVTSRIPGARDAILPGVNGFLVDDPCSGSQLAAGLLPLLENGVREQFSVNAASSSRQFQWPIVLQQYEHVLCQHQN